MKRLLLLIPLLFACDNGPVEPEKSRPPQVALTVQVDNFDHIGGGKAIYVYVTPERLRSMADEVERGDIVYLDGSRLADIANSEFVVVIK